MVDVVSTVTVTVEVPAGGFVKRSASGEVDFISPLPSWFNYGSIEGWMGEDGEPADAIVLGPRLPRGVKVRREVWAKVDFIDGGKVDTKWIVGDRRPRRFERRAILTFLSAYGVLKGTIRRMLGRPGLTQRGRWTDLPGTP